MSKRTWLLGAGAIGLIAAALFGRGFFTGDGAATVRAPAERAVPVETAKAERQKVPVKLDSLGTVTPIASVAIKSRVDTAITNVHFSDGAHVKQGDLLFRLDCRQVEAEMKKTQAVIDGAQAQLEQAQRDVERYTELTQRNATPVVTLNNAQTQVNISRATADSNRAQLENLKVQLGFCEIRAPISGRISMANVKAGNFVRQADTQPMATIIQLAPVYVSFTVPQKNLFDIRQALAAETATVRALLPGSARQAEGQVSMIENTVDAATGMAMVRATMPNNDETLWPGTLVNVEITLRSEDAVVVPAPAVQVSQTGSFVFVVENGAARVRPVTVERTVNNQAVISKGLEGGETVVTDGHMLLSNGTRVNPRTVRQAGT